MFYQMTPTFNVPAKILRPVTTKVNGVTKKDFEESEVIYISAKSYGGTEKIINDLYVIEDTMIVETYFRPDITSDCNLMLLDDNSTWEILNTPENIDRRNIFLKFKIKRIKGKA